MEKNPLKFNPRGKKESWLRARLAEVQYNRRLQQVAKQIKAIIQGFNVEGTERGITPLIKALNGYSDLIEPWAESVAGLMLSEVNTRNLQAWKRHGEDLSSNLRFVVAQTPVGAEYRGLLRENVKLIKSLPQKAAIEVHASVQKGLLASTRSTEIAKQILETSNIPVWRAKLIARTETSRASATLTQARAMAIGSKGYIWQTVGDGDVRPTHKEQEGKYILWTQPPKTDKDLAPYHAGCGPSCRCWMSPVLPEF